MSKLTANLGLVALLSIAASCAASSPEIDEMTSETQTFGSEITAYTGAALFDGEAFVSATLCIADAVIVACPDVPDERVQLTGAYITPPFGDTHTHHFDGPYTLDWHRSLSLDAGVFYAMTMTAPASGVRQIREQLSGPGNVDVQTSLGGITGPQSHPAEIYEALALGFRSYEEQVANVEAIHASSLVADDAYYVVETEQDVRAKMDMLLAERPDHIKVFLRHSERYDEDFGKWGPGGGIDPELLPYIAQITEQAGLRLAVATSTVSDFRESLKVQADIITHIQCYQNTEADPTSIYYDVDAAEECLLNEEDANAAARIGMASTFVVTEWAKERPAKYAEWEKQNITALEQAGAPIVVAVEAYGSQITDGLIAGVDKGFFSAADMLRIATMETPAFIFPDRQVGCLEVGCEASFLAFSSNPLEDFNSIRTFSYRLKDGQKIEDRAE